MKIYYIYIYCVRIRCFRFHNAISLQVFQGISSATQECKKYLKNKTSAQYFRIYPQSWQNHIALRVALYKDDVKSKGMKKKGDKSGSTSPMGDRPQSPTMRKKIQLTKEDISVPMYPSSDCLITEVCDINGESLLCKLL